MSAPANHMVTGGMRILQALKVMGIVMRFTFLLLGWGISGFWAQAFCFRQKRVIGVDINQRAFDAEVAVKLHVEPALGVAVQKMAAVEGGFLRATTTPVEADAYLIAVPTPFKGDHDPDLTCGSRGEIHCAGIKKGHW